MMLRLRAGRSGYQAANSHLDGGHAPAPASVKKEQPPVERPLNVVFNYNGHSWDAYEVLGLPAGSSPDKVEEAYKAQLASVEAGSRPFLDAAYAAIKAPRSN
jgi:hypothetical protein